MAIEFSLDEINGMTNFDQILGGGGTSTVYRGRIHTPNAHNLNEQEVAVKVISDENTGNRRAMWQAEVTWLPLLIHPNIVTLVGYCEDPASNTFYIVYEYVSEHSLEDRRRGLNWEGVLRVLRGVANGLLHIHSYRPQILMYGDLKPENIVLQENVRGMHKMMQKCGCLRWERCKT
ncbi:probable serine/threonine-protein kinase PBL16 isoform X2 [Cornus florida]|uniref:probable serine/threonine-protein kinase PBL16 isoform X2 n=1 Tax=Cornus florida TaxID=4283 RepID=UPI0028A27866|nr:probable serine/threonine-protein kinase PBL16 isoform X2 [Cornus florida]XP_059631753.1 probable serine/threonine-protein kinase PBL16 isoform X2 [Cornus florida]